MYLTRHMLPLGRYDFTCRPDHACEKVKGKFGDKCFENLSEGQARFPTELFANAVDRDLQFLRTGTIYIT